MNLKKELEEKKLTIELEGRVDTTTAPELDAAIKEDIENIEELVIDMAKLEYISSAGLRVLLSAQKELNNKGTMIVTKVDPSVMEVFEITGFDKVLNIQ